MLSDERIRQFVDDIYCSEGTHAEIAYSIRAALAEASQVPVMGEVVAYLVPCQTMTGDVDMKLSFEPSGAFVGHSIGERVPLYTAPATSITQAELDSLRQDAERYQWLRMQGAQSDKVDKVHYFGPKLDEAIDAAIAVEGEKK